MPRESPYTTRLFSFGIRGLYVSKAPLPLPSKDLESVLKDSK